MIEITNKRVLVTGGAGFVGSNIVKELLNKGSIVTILDNLYTGDIKLIPDSENVTFVKGDVEDRQLVNNLVKEHPLIIHAAAKNIIVSTKNPYEDFKTNIEGTLNVLLAARKHGVEKIVYTGSASVYGNPTHLPINENSSVYTLSPYAVSKLAGENYFTSFYESYDLPATIVRYSNVYGDNQSPSNPYCGVIAKFFDLAINNNPLNIHGDGEQTRDFTYVKDAAHATVLALQNQRSTGMIFNIGTGIETSVNSLARSIVEITKSNSAINHLDKRDIDNIRRRVVGIEQIRRMLRWSPSYNLKEGLKLTYEWIKTQNLN